MKQLTILATCVMLLSSCAYRFGNISQNVTTNSGKAKTVGVAFGQAKASKVMYLGGLTKPSLLYKAKQDLYQNVVLKEGQYLANFTIEYKYSNFIFVQNTLAQVHAEIIDTTNLYPMSYDVLNYGDYSLGDTIYTANRFTKGVVSNFTSNKLIYQKLNGKKKKVKYDDCFVARGSINIGDKVYSIGDKMNIKGQSHNSVWIFKYVNCKLVALTGSKFLVKDSNGSFYSFKLSDKNIVTKL